MKKGKKLFMAPAPDIIRTIGTLDRCLSEMLVLAEHPDTNAADQQTLKHHADDLEGVASKVKKLLEQRRVR